MGDTYTQLSGKHPDNDAQVIVDTAFAAAEAERVEAGEILSVMIPAGGRQEVIDLERYLDAPRRPRGTATLHTGQSLAAYVNEAGDKDDTSLYADVEKHSIVGVLNDDHGAAAGWRDRRAQLTLRTTEAWDTWTAADGKPMSQTDFAELVEDRLIDILNPPGAELLELAQTLQVNSKVNFRQSNRLADGQHQLTYEETNEASAGTLGQITVPPTFTLLLQPFEGSDTQEVTARLRYRVREGRLAIGYRLERPLDVLAEAFNEVLAQVESDTGLTAYHGSPPAPLP